MEYTHKLSEARSLTVTLVEQGCSWRGAIYMASEAKEVDPKDLGRVIKNKKNWDIKAIPHTSRKEALTFQSDYDLINMVESEKEEPSEIYL